MKTFICWILAHLRVPAFLGFWGFPFFLGALGEEASIDLLASWGMDAKTVGILVFGSLSVISLCGATWAMLFTYRNFDEVWSRSMRYRNSNVTKFGKKLRYSIKIFFQSLCVIGGLPTLLGSLMLILTAPNIE